MAKIVLNVVVNDKAAVQSISSLEKQLKQIGSGGSKKVQADLNAIGAAGERASVRMGWFTRSLAYSAVNSFTDSLKNALATMKAVDTELVTVRKVTGAAADEIRRLKDEAYDVAGAYGIAPDAMLSNVAAFAKAGYGNMASELGELAVKATLVGDTTETVAQQFLLSVDAAYKYGGSVEKLGQVLDGLNEIENRNATTIEKIADGMGIVAPIAAQARVGIDELAAALGTITAVTQRSGSEAARALRALFLNIIGDTKTEIDEGVTWTTGEIAGLREVLNLYAADVVKAAEATGQVVNPMEAIAALAQSLEDGILTEAKLMEMVSDIGGKLRTSQLLAIVQNWDMYEKMLSEYAGAFGSAEREVENAMDSWERKAQQLESKWAEFWDGTLSTEVVKETLTLLTGVVDWMDTGVGRAVSLTAAIYGIGTALAVVGKSNAIRTLVSDLKSAEVRAKSLKSLFVGLGVTIAVSLFDYLNSLPEQTTRAYEDQLSAWENLKDEYSATYSEGSEYYDLMQKSADSLTTVEKNRLTVLEAQKRAMEGQVAEAQKLSYEAFRAAQDQEGVYYNQSTGVMESTTKGREDLRGLQSAYDSALSKYTSGESNETAYLSELGNLISSYEYLYNTLIKYRDLGYTLTQDEQTLIALYESMAGAVSSVAVEVETAAESVQTATISTAELKEQFEALNGALDSAQSAIDAVRAAWDEYQQTGTLAVETLQSLAALGPEYVAALVDENGQIRLNQEAMDGLIAQKRALIEEIFAEQIASYTLGLVQEALAQSTGDLGTAESGAATGIDEATDALVEQAAAALQDAAAINELRGAIEGVAGGGLSDEAIDDIFNKVADFTNRSRALLGAYGTGGTGGTSAGGTSAGGSAAATATQDISALASAYQTLSDAVSQYNQSGALTVDTFNQLLSLEPQYLALLVSENGQLMVNEAAYRSMTAARIDDAAASQALAMAEEALRLARLGDAEALAILLGQTVATTSATWAHVEAIYSQISAMEASGQVALGTAAAMRTLIDTYQQMSTAAVKGLQSVSAAATASSAISSAASSTLSSSADSAADALRKQYDMEKKLLEVERARRNLQEAESERTVRIYNASTGQWEWVADAKAVQAAKDALEDAEHNLRVARASSSSGGIKVSGASSGTPTYTPPESTGQVFKALKPGAIKEMVLGHMLNPTMKKLDDDDDTKVFDSGGVLKGMGGIKATSADEMILPPDITRRMLSPMAGSQFSKRTAELRWLYGGGGVGRTEQGRSGDVYQFGGITIGEEKAKSTTVHQMAQMAKTLRIHNNAQN